MNEDIQRTTTDRVVLVALQLILLLIPVVLYFRDPVRYVSLITDDQFGEFVSFAAFGIASLLLGICFFRSRTVKRRIWFALLAVLAFLISMEEISWGQRIVGIGTPDFFKAYNAQGELGFHNIRAISPESTTYLVVAAAILLYSFLPILYRHSLLVRRTVDWFATPLPALSLMPILIGTAYFLAVSTLVKSDEIGEYFLSLSILLLSAHWLSGIVEDSPHRYVLTLISLSLAFLVAGGFTKYFGSEQGRISRLHSTAERMIDRNHSRSALQIMEYVQVNPELHRPNTTRILARALRAEGKPQAANSLLSETVHDLQASLEREFSVSQALLLASIYTDLGEDDRARSVQMDVLRRLEEEVEAGAPEGDELARLLIDISDAQRTLGRKEAAMRSLLTAAAAARAAIVSNSIEYRLGSLADLCAEPPVEDDDRRIPRDRMDSLKGVNWSQFCQRTENI